MKTLALLAAALLTACDAAPDTGEASAAQPALDAGVLAGRSLSASSLPQAHLLATPSGRDLLARVVSCALPRGATITTITSDGTPFSFTGALGLAPGWAAHAPTGDERRRVTDCVRTRSTTV